MTIRVDGVEYRVRVEYKSMKRAFEIVEGDNSGVSLTARKIRDILGTSYTYTMNIEPDLKYPEDYDNLYAVLSKPVASHEITLPYGQTTITFDAAIVSGTDTWGGRLAGFNRWNGLSVTFYPIEPQNTEAY